MDEELENDLIDEYPKLYRWCRKSEEELEEEEIVPPIALFHFACGDGWYDIIDSLSDYLEGLNDRDDAEHTIEAHQVKEKFGGLRFYTGGYPPQAAGAFRVASNLSFKVCEHCGSPGEVRRGGWIRVRCDECYEAEQEERRQRFENRNND